MLMITLYAEQKKKTQIYRTVFYTLWEKVRVGWFKSKRLLISWLQSPSTVILEMRKIKSATVSTVSPSISHEVMS